MTLGSNCLAAYEVPLYTLFRKFTGLTPVCGGSVNERNVIKVSVYGHTRFIINLGIDYTLAGLAESEAESRYSNEEMGQLRSELEELRHA